MSRPTVLLLPLLGALATSGLANTAHADWQEVSFDVIAVGAPGTMLQPSIASGVDYPTDDFCEIEPCALDEPVPVTRVAYIDTANNNALMLASRFGPPGEPWTLETVYEENAQHPYLILDRDGQTVMSFLEGWVGNSFPFEQIKIARRTSAALGNAGQLDSIFVRTVVAGNTTQPVPITLQYYGWDLSPTGAERGIHMLHSSGGIHHTFLDEEGFWPGPRNTYWYQPHAIFGYLDPNTEDWTPDNEGSQGAWPDAAPLWTDLAEDPDDIFAYEALPAVAYQNNNITFTRAYQEYPWDSSSAPSHDFTDPMELWHQGDLRPSVDAVRDYPAAVVWSPPCPEAGNLLFNQSDPDEPWTLGDWPQPQWAGAENACDAELSIVESINVPWVAFADPYSGEVGITVRPDAGGPWYSAMIGEGAEPTIDYNRLTKTQAVAYVQPANGELRVVDGFWD